MWIMTEFTTLSETVVLDSIDMQLTMLSIFEGVDFPENKKFETEGYAIKL